MILVSGDIRSMRIFAEVPWEGDVKRQWGVSCCRRVKIGLHWFDISRSQNQNEIRFLWSDSATTGAACYMSGHQVRNSDSCSLSWNLCIILCRFLEIYGYVMNIIT